MYGYVYSIYSKYMHIIPMKVHSKDLRMSEIETISYFVYQQPLKILP